MNIPTLTSIILLGTENAVALPAIRSIRAAFPSVFIHTISADTDAIQISNYSRYVNYHHRVESPDCVNFIHQLVNIIQKTGAEILLPVNESYTRIISENRELLSKYIKLPPMPSPQLLDSVVQKDLLAGLLQTEGYPAPNTLKLSEVDLNTLNHDLFPCLLKPIRSSTGIGIQKIEHFNTFKKLLPKLQPHNHILQEFIPGEDIDCSFIAVDGHIKAYTIQRGLTNKGYSFSTAIRFEHNELLYQQVKSFIRSIGYSGIAHLDFRLDNRDNRYKLIDFNARYWFSMEGSKAAGINFALLNCLEAMQVPYKRPTYNPCIYLLGQSTFRRFNGLLSQSDKTHYRVYTDMKSRMIDPLPELLRYF